MSRPGDTPTRSATPSILYSRHMTEVVARQLPATRMQRVLVGWNAVGLPLLIGLNLHLPWWGIAVAVAVGAGVLLPLGAALTATRLEITDDALVVRRRLRPVVIPRDAITAVDGDVPHRPTWSSVVVVTTEAGERKLPVFAQPGIGEIVERLQDWSGTRPPEEAPARRAVEPDGPIGRGVGPDGPIYL